MEKHSRRKTVMQGLKRLMTVTEKDVVEEKEREKKTLREANPVRDDVNKENIKLSTAEKSTASKDKKAKKPFLKIVESTQHFEELDEQDSEDEFLVENEDSVELIGNHERNVQERAKNPNNKKADDDDDDDDDDEIEKSVSYSKYESSDTPKGSSNKPEKIPRKKKRSIFKSIFKIGQALNAKPDEFVSDEELSKLKSHKDDESSTLDDKLEQKENRVDENNFADTFEAKERTSANIPILEDIDMSFATVQKVNGNIFIEGNIEPMYTIETSGVEFNVEIGKLTPILMYAYEAYLEPDVLKAKKEEEDRRRAEVSDEEIITKATTAFTGIEEPDELEQTEGQQENKAEVNNVEDNSREEVNEYSKEEIENIDKEYEKLTEQELKKKEKQALKRERKAKRKEERRVRKENKRKILSEYSSAVDYSAFIVTDDVFEAIDDYETPQDARVVKAEMNLNIRKLIARTIVTGVMFLLTLVMIVFQRFFSDIVTGILPNAEIWYCIITLVMLSVCIGVSRATMRNGLVPLIGLRGNSDTALSVAAIASVLQCIVAFFDCKAFYEGTQGLYAVLVMFGLSLNALGKLVMILRIRDNFTFVSNDRKKYAATIFNDRRKAERMVKGTNAAEAIIGYQRKTEFYSDFLKLSYSKDSSEDMAEKLSIASTICAVVVSVLHGVIFKNVIGAVSSFAMISSISVPVACLLSINIPMKRLCEKALCNDAMIVGYPAVCQFVDTSAIMVDSKELYPYSSVELVGMNSYVPEEVLRMELLNAAAVLKLMNTSLTSVFSELINKKNSQLPYVDSVTFEEKRGIVGWVGGQRVLIGTRALMEAYHIELPPADDEEQYLAEHRDINYIASAGRLLARLVVSYSVEKKLINDVKALEQNGVSLLIRTVDPNLTARRIAMDYGIHEQSVKILPSSLGRVCRDAVHKYEKTARCYIGTRGKFSSLAGAVCGCIKIKSNITTAVIVQAIGVVLGILFTSAIALMSNDIGIGPIEFLSVLVFFTVVSIVVPLLRKPYK